VADAEEDKAFGKDRRGDEMAAWTADKEKRLAKIREAKAALEAEAKAAAETKVKAGQEAEEKRKREGRKKSDKKPKPPSGEPEAKANATSPIPIAASCWPRMAIFRATTRRSRWMKRPKSSSPMS
jgi:hypothetical protein